MAGSKDAAHDAESVELQISKVCINGEYKYLVFEAEITALEQARKKDSGESVSERSIADLQPSLTISQTVVISENVDKSTEEMQKKVASMNKAQRLSYQQTIKASVNELCSKLNMDGGQGGRSDQELENFRMFYKAAALAKERLGKLD